MKIQHKERMPKREVPIPEMIFGMANTAAHIGITMLMALIATLLRIVLPLTTTSPIYPARELEVRIHRIRGARTEMRTVTKSIPG